MSKRFLPRFFKPGFFIRRIPPASPAELTTGCMNAMDPWKTGRIVSHRKAVLQPGLAERTMPFTAFSVLSAEKEFGIQVE
jgi:hypothetical protein